MAGNWGTDPDHYSVFLLFHFPFEETHQIEITVNPEERSKPLIDDHDLDSADLQLHAVQRRLGDPGRRPCAIFLTSHSSATRHQWLNLFSTRHECFTSDVGLTRTRLVSCILLTSLIGTRNETSTSQLDVTREALVTSRKEVKPLVTSRRRV